MSETFAPTKPVVNALLLLGFQEKAGVSQCPTGAFADDLFLVSGKIQEVCVCI